MTQPSVSNRKNGVRPRIDLTGRKVGRLTVIEFSHRKKTACGLQYYWLCKCDCGTEKIVDGTCLRRKSTLSCGCYGRERSTVHGMSDHPLYEVWCGIKSRCYCETSDCFPHYGGRGIRMCDEWKESFAAFYSDMGDRPTPLHTIERVNNDGNYEPSNCVWATRAEQNENTRQTRLITFDGITLSLSKWAKRIGIGRQSLRKRLRTMDVETALTKPFTRGPKRKGIPQP